MNNVLALDCSTKRTGFAYFKDDQIQYGAISASSTSPEKRIGIMRDSIVELLKQEKEIDTIILEDVHPSQEINQRTHQLLMWLQGCIVVAVYEYNKNIKIEFIGASSWRRILKIQGYRILREEQKKRDIAFANQIYGLGLTADMDDEADSICILTAYLKGAETAATSHPLGPIGSDESAF